MTDEDILLQAVIENADDNSARLVYADWLEENGEPDRAEFVRVQCELAKLPDSDIRRDELQARKEQLLWVAYREDWVRQFGVAMTWDSALTMFKRRLAEAVAWCRNRNVQFLRTPALEPASLLGQFVPLADGQRIWRWSSTAEQEAIVNDLANRRTKLLADDGWHTKTSVGEPTGGRLLLFDPSGTLSHFAAVPESNGFYDGKNEPAWDTWVWYAEDRNLQEGSWTPFSTYLVVWVPPEMVEIADRGIRANPEKCIRWASDVDTALTRRLRASGLLN